MFGEDGRLQRGSSLTRFGSMARAFVAIPVAVPEQVHQGAGQQQDVRSQAQGVLPVLAQDEEGNDDERGSQPEKDPTVRAR